MRPTPNPKTRPKVEILTFALVNDADLIGGLLNPSPQVKRLLDMADELSVTSRDKSSRQQ
ncbi:hypothetical protein ACFQ1S_00595 [Kibdelosporangium lantanae]|uniref:Uncharacterized protein n=1 Tax=Kibdelosporangium lantanae TaxID=1497396 RepID=A0ABW3M2T8_9PSEU